MVRTRAGFAQLARVEIVRQAQFGSFVASRTKVIVQVGFGSRPSFLKDVLRYFAAEHRETIRFGYLDRTGAVAYPAWSLKHFGPVLESQRVAPSEAPDGYYLFANSQAVAFHPAVIVDHQNDLA